MPPDSKTESHDSDRAESAGRVLAACLVLAAGDVERQADLILATWSRDMTDSESASAVNTALLNLACGYVSKLLEFADDDVAEAMREQATHVVSFQTLTDQISDYLKDQS
ncbi:hypothetical protein [Microbacterium sp. C7(2022)]|uniref:hypothetical protein n=1 Tax=Microbacterium sp. C7(2022) TaxID=2992759 RepID=UPI00237A3E0C|nr:hypothetical protein [Microbacterium sp. C7(2022)]MDE0545443.1 hypothetical protein [Microbacterium sp. C7(2022)]